MSKTFRDKHYNTYLKELWQQGKIEHDHRFLGQGSPIGTLKKYSYSPQYSTYYYKEDYIKALHYINTIKKEHPQAKIIVEEHKIIVDKIENKIYFNDNDSFNLTNSFNNDIIDLNHYSGIEYDGYVKKKIITITVELLKEKQYYTKYCTDWEHYDPITNTDTRDNGIVTCKPNLYDTPYEFHIGTNKCYCYYCTDGKYKKKVRQDKDLNNIRLDYYKDYYNSGLTVEELYNI